MKKKVWISLIIVLVVALAAGFDYWRSLQYKVEVVEMTPAPAVADGRSPVKVTISLTRDGLPVSGHNLFALSPDGGGFEAYRVKTGEDGRAAFTYFPYAANAIRKAKPVELKFVDQSNSVFIEINARASIMLELVEPQPSETKSDFSLNDIFGDE